MKQWCFYFYNHGDDMIALIINVQTLKVRGCNITCLLVLKKIY